MNSVLLRVVARLLASLLLTASIYLLWRGHNAPGGGFSGGIMAAAAFVLLAISFDPDAGWRAPRLSPLVLIPLGLLVALGSGFIGVLTGGAFLEGRWVTLGVGEGVKLGTPLLFDLGVYLVVVGVALAVIIPLMREEE
ncbi:MnhB domain-containing protein [Tepidiforma sp.]|uniref:MnhB domain-containing protein n=1 Tax=Tepidiforma sp. TaxID=2682230 RepID=UPI002ADE21FE|nr:MnhB domain-containing protein [Tepidiforma sp.]